MFDNLLIWIIAINSLYLAYRVLTRPQISKKQAIDNIIEAIVESRKHLTAEDKIVLIKKELDEIEANEVPQWQRDAFVEEVLKKFVKKC